MSELKTKITLEGGAEDRVDPATKKTKSSQWLEIPMDSLSVNPVPANANASGNFAGLPGGDDSRYGSQVRSSSYSRVCIHRRDGTRLEMDYPLSPSSLMALMECFVRSGVG